MNESCNAASQQQRIISLVEMLGSTSAQAEPIEALAVAMLTRHRSVMRLRYGLSAESIGFASVAIPWYPLAYREDTDQVRPSKTLEYAGGDFYLQDGGSLLALAAANADAPSQPDRLICDLCAAPGGKATALLESIGGGFLLANEPIRSRLPALEHNLARTGSDRYAVASLDPENLADRLPGMFDLVLVDAPCSGQALLGKGKQSLSAISAPQIQHSALRARRILAAAVQLLRPGGQLVFSTCTFAEQENETQVRWLVDQHGMSPRPIDRLCVYGSGVLDCTYRLWPHRHACAGSFAASLERADGDAVRNVKLKRRKVKDRPPQELQHWFDSVPPRLVPAGGVVWGWPEDAPEWTESIAASGPEVAYRTGQTWKPSHAAALRRERACLDPTAVSVDDATARHYLAGNPIDCSRKGWCVVEHRGRPLGWLKASGGTGKNHLPTAARIAW